MASAPSIWNVYLTPTTISKRAIVAMFQPVYHLNDDGIPSVSIGADNFPVPEGQIVGNKLVLHDGKAQLVVKVEMDEEGKLRVKRMVRMILNGAENENEKVAEALQTYLEITLDGMKAMGLEG